MTTLHIGAASARRAGDRSVRIGVAAGIGLLAVTLTACGGGHKTAEVTTEVAAQLQSVGVLAGKDSVDCADKLSAEVGDTVTCSFTADDGQPVDAVATVAAVDGDKVAVDLSTEARPIPKDVLAKSVSERVAQEAGVDITSSTCAGDLDPKVGESTTCDLAAGSETRTMTVTVLSVDGGLINYAVDGA